MNSELPSLFFGSRLKRLGGLKLGRAFLRGIVSHARSHIKILSFLRVMVVDLAKLSPVSFMPEL